MSENIERFCDLLNVMRDKRMTITEITEAADISRYTAQKHVATLVARGFVDVTEHDAERRQCGPGRPPHTYIVNARWKGVVMRYSASEIEASVRKGYPRARDLKWSEHGDMGYLRSTIDGRMSVTPINLPDASLQVTADDIARMLVMAIASMELPS